MQEQIFEVLPENGPAVRTLLGTSTQWLTESLSTMSGARIVRTGLDYIRAEYVAGRRGIVLSDDDFARLQALEAECLTAWAEERQAAQ